MYFGVRYQRPTFRSTTYQFSLVGKLFAALKRNITDRRGGTADQRHESAIILLSVFRFASRLLAVRPTAHSAAGARVARYPDPGGATIAKRPLRLDEPMTAVSAATVSDWALPIRRCRPASKAFILC
jgi:hypothetical protein